MRLRLISGLSDTLMELLRPRYVVRADERVYVSDEDAVRFEHREPFLSIFARGSAEVVTVIEVLSPTNKRGDGSEGRRAYLAKRRQVLHSEAHLVEIDLLRAGQRVPMARPLPAADYVVIVSRAPLRPECDVFPSSLRDPLPTVPIPLLGDEAVEVDLQALLDSVYARAGYDLDVDYGREPVPPLSPEDAAWAAARSPGPT
ncbi:MAG: DUF4058 family protein [Planctomycetes bacterium]|nr:DUF4058 family protein [Planctomycetota bacterium]